MFLFLHISKRSSSPEPKPKPEPIDHDEQVANGSGEGMDVDTPDADLVKDTYSLPAPIPLSFVRYPVTKPDVPCNLDLILQVQIGFIDYLNIYDCISFRITSISYNFVKMFTGLRLS